MKHKVVAIVQARIASSRLPGKVLKDIEGLPMLGRVVERTTCARTIDELVVATTNNPEDEAVVDCCRSLGVRCMRGSHYDVLDRYHAAAQQSGADMVVRITADCPLIDASLIDVAVRTMTRPADRPSKVGMDGGTSFDFVTNRLPPPWRRTYPIGLDTEVCTFSALERAWTDSSEAVEREHVMPYLYAGLVLDNRSPHLSTGTSPNGFRVALLNHSEDLGNYRWTVDTAEDLEFVRTVYRHLATHDGFNWLDVLALVRSRPDIASINAGVQHKTLSDIDARATRAKLP